MNRLVLVAALVGSSACVSDHDDRPRTLNYVTEAILVPSCGQAECHSSFHKEAGDDFGTVAATRETLVRGDWVLGGNNPTSTSLILLLTTDSIVRDGDAIRMPYDQPMPDEDVDLLEAWLATAVPIGGDPGMQAPADTQCYPFGPDATHGCDANGTLVVCTDGFEGPAVTDPEVTCPAGL